MTLASRTLSQVRLNVFAGSLCLWGLSPGSNSTSPERVEHPSAPPYSGATLRVLSFKDGHAEAVAKKLPEFEKMTGAKVAFDMIAAQSVASKTAADQAGGGSYDVYAVDEPFLPQIAEFLVPVEKWPPRKLISAAETSAENFLASAWEGG